MDAPFLFKLSLAVSAIAVVTGCSTLQQQGQPSRYAEMSASGELIEVYVPGSVPNYYDPPGKTPNPLLNPRMTPPAFTEASPLPRYCMAGKVEAGLSSNLEGVVDKQQFDELMRVGYGVARDRHVWRFNVERTEAQLKVVSGNRTTTRNAAPRPSPVQQAKPLDLSGLFGNAGQQRSRPGMHSAAEINAKLPNFEKMRADLEYNQSVLAQQDAAMNDRERRYAEQLLSFYQSAQSRFVAVPVNQQSLQALNIFDRFRQNNVDTCLMRAGSLQRNSAKSPTIDPAYAGLVRTIIAGARASVSGEINRATSAVSLQETSDRLFSTMFLRNVAEEDREITQVMKAKSVQLDAQEARARQLAKQKAEQEAERLLALQRKHFLENAAKNVPPTADDITRLVSDYVMEKTEQRKAYGRLVRTSPTAFDYYVDVGIFGTSRLGAFSSSIANLSCKADRGHQRCQFTELRTYDELILWPFSQDSLERPGTRSGMVHDAEFMWTERGLQSAELKKNLYAAGPTYSRAASRSTSGNTDEYQSRQDRMNEHYDNMRDRSREEAEERQRQQEAAQRQWQEEQDRRREMNRSRCPNYSNICN